MEFKDSSNRRRKVFVLLGVVLALVAGGAAFYLSSQGTAQAVEVPMKTVVVAVNDIPARVVLDSGMLAQREVADDPSVAQAVDDPALLIGRLTGVSIYANQPVTPNLLATNAAGAEFSILSPTETVSPDSPAWRAVSVMVPKERAVGGHVEIGQRLDFFATIKIETLVPNKDGKLESLPDAVSGNQPGLSTKLSWEDVEILAKDDDADIYVLKVELHQAEEISHMMAAKDLGFELDFSFALRPDGDSRPVARGGYGETIERIFEQYNLPVPRILDLDTYPQPGAEPSPFVPTP